MENRYEALMQLYKRGVLESFTEQKYGLMNRQPSVVHGAAAEVQRKLADVNGLRIAGYENSDFYSGVNLVSEILMDAAMSCEGNDGLSSTLLTSLEEAVKKLDRRSTVIELEHARDRFQRAA